LESLSLILYDKYRPLILRENKIDELVDLCQSLLSYFVDSKMEKKESVVDLMREEEKIDSSSIVKFLARKTLEDAQARLVFRAQEFIQAEITNFTPRIETIELFARGRGCIYNINVLVPMPNVVNSNVGVAPVIDDLYDEELDTYPEALGIHIPDAHGMLENEKQPLNDIPNPIFSGKMVYGAGEYFPTLQKTLYILGRLYGSLPVICTGN